MATQQLAGEGFTKVINLSGGIRAWQGLTAYGDVEQGLFLFDKLDSLADILKTAYSLEEGLQDFYIDLLQQAEDEQLIILFRKLSDIEDVHKENVFKEYVRITGDDDRTAFENDVRKDCMEGGMTTAQYIDLFKPDLTDPVDCISLAMSIEAQAYDLYTRAAKATEIEENKRALKKIANEEMYHIDQLSKLMDTILEEKNE